MTYVITSRCVGSKDGSCTSVCPVDCISPAPGDPAFDGAEQLYIDPAECIECDACVSVCPADAIYLHTEVPSELADAAETNAQFYR